MLSIDVWRRIKKKISQPEKKSGEKNLERQPATKRLKEKSGIEYYIFTLLYKEIDWAMSFIWKRGQLGKASPTRIVRDNLLVCQLEIKKVS